MLFAAALTSAREREKLSKLDLARETGVSYSHIDNIERGRRLPTLDTVKKLDKRLHFPIKVLLALIRGPEFTGALRRVSVALLGLLTW